MVAACRVGVGHVLLVGRQTLCLSPVGVRWLTVEWTGPLPHTLCTASRGNRPQAHGPPAEEQPGGGGSALIEAGLPTTSGLEQRLSASFAGSCEATRPLAEHAMHYGCRTTLSCRGW